MAACEHFTARGAVSSNHVESGSFTLVDWKDVANCASGLALHPVCGAGAATAPKVFFCFS